MSKVMFERARDLETQGKLQEAWELRRTIYKAHPNHGLASLGLAICLQMNGDLVEAEKFYKVTISKKPEWELASLAYFHFLWDNDQELWEKDRRVDRRDEAFSVNFILSRLRRYCPWNK